MPPAAETQLAYLGFRLIQPAPLLQPYVDSYWCFNRTDLLHEEHQEYMHPSGGFGLVFNLGGPLRWDNQLVTAPVLLDGANSRSRQVGFRGHIDLLGIRFRVGGAFPILGIPLIELRDELYVLEAIEPESLRELHTCLYAAATLAARITLLDGWLIERLAAGLTRSGVIAASLARLRQEVSTLREGQQLPSIPRLADDLGISQRQLEHLYRQQVGLTPRQYIKLQRIEVARLALAQHRQSNTDLAADLGYYDQAHFIREFSAVVGMTPYAYMRRKHRGT